MRCLTVCLYKSTSISTYLSISIYLAPSIFSSCLTMSTVCLHLPSYLSAFPFPIYLTVYKLSISISLSLVKSIYLSTQSIYLAISLPRSTLSSLHPIDPRRFAPRHVFFLHSNYCFSTHTMLVPITLPHPSLPHPPPTDPNIYYIMYSSFPLHSTSLSTMKSNSFPDIPFWLSTSFPSPLWLASSPPVDQDSFSNIIQQSMQPNTLSCFPSWLSTSFPATLRLAGFSYGTKARGANPA